MNEDHECHDRVRPKVLFLLFCFSFCGTWLQPRTGQQSKLNRGPARVVEDRGCCSLSYPRLTFFVIDIAWLFAEGKSASHQGGI